jgi:hypothetical protein
MRYHDVNRNKNLYRCDRCGRDGLPSIINSRSADHCLECWNKANKAKADEAEKGLYLSLLKREVKFCIDLHP